MTSGCCSSRQVASCNVDLLQCFTQWVRISIRADSWFGVSMCSSWHGIHFWTLISLQGVLFMICSQDLQGNEWLFCAKSLLDGILFIFFSRDFSVEDVMLYFVQRTRLFKAQHSCTQDSFVQGNTFIFVHMTRLFKAQHLYFLCFLWFFCPRRNRDIWTHDSSVQGATGATLVFCTHDSSVSGATLFLVRMILLFEASYTCS